MLKIKSQKYRDIVYVIKQNERCQLFEVWISYDRGRTGSLMPRIDTKTDENCYHKSGDLAIQWCNKYEGVIFNERPKQQETL